jgi:hypothetical protein
LRRKNDFIYNEYRILILYVSLIYFIWCKRHLILQCILFINTVFFGNISSKSCKIPRYVNCGKCILYWAVFWRSIEGWNYKSPNFLSILCLYSLCNYFRKTISIPCGIFWQVSVVINTFRCACKIKKIKI